MKDASEGVSAFAGAEQVSGLGIELRTPLDELGYARRALGDEGFSGGATDDAIASFEGVFEVEGYVLFAFHGDGDAALGVVGVGFAEGFLGDDEDFTVGSQFDSGAEAGYTCAHDQKINLRGPWHVFLRLTLGRAGVSGQGSGVRYQRTGSMSFRL
jgi:hypothetical protein